MAGNLMGASEAVVCPYCDARLLRDESLGAERTCSNCSRDFEPPLGRTLFSIHGIRTRGAWQKQLQIACKDFPLHHAPLDFGFFRAVGLLIPYCRRKQIDWFRDQYHDNIGHGEAPPSIIAHSFGTYLVARSLEIYGDTIAFDRIIFCGSIVRQDFPWSVLISRGKCRAILNETGRKDLPATVAGFFVDDAGPSGQAGFNDEHVRLKERPHSEFGHSDFFFRRNYQAHWLPFVLGKLDLEPVLELPPATGNWRFTVLRAILASLVLLAIAFWATRGGAPPSKKYVGTLGTYVTEWLDQKKLGRLSQFKSELKTSEVEWFARIVEAQTKSGRNQYILEPACAVAENGLEIIATFTKNYQPSVSKGQVIKFTGEIGDGGTGRVIVVLDNCALLDKVTADPDCSGQKD
jgi:DNA-directed RNA polymerase subunit RPC12/RpoP